MNKFTTQLCFALALLCSSALVAAQSAGDADQTQGAASDTATGLEQEEIANDAQAQQNQDGSSQDVAQVEDEEEDSAGRFIPTEQLSQDLGASFPVDI